METVWPDGVAGVVLTHDARRRLIAESRSAAVRSGDPGGSSARGATPEYDLEYEYDLGGNRTRKVDYVNEVETLYFYDNDDVKTYETFNNRLMAYETYDFSGKKSTLLATTWYDYNVAGNPIRIVTQASRGLQSARMFGSAKASPVWVALPTDGPSRFEFAKNGQTVTFITGETWESGAICAAAAMWHRTQMSDGAWHRFETGGSGTAFGLETAEAVWHRFETGGSGAAPGLGTAEAVWHRFGTGGSGAAPGLETAEAVWHRFGTVGSGTAFGLETAEAVWHRFETGGPGEASGLDTAYKAVPHGAPMSHESPADESTSALQGAFPVNYDVIFVSEFRYDGGRQRYLNREFDADDLNLGTPVFTVVSETWTDYDGDEPFGDWTIDNGNPVNARSFELGLATVDPFASSGAANTKYFHADMLGTTRSMSAGGTAAEGAVYTAFGERIDGTNHRYGYVGAWGYQSHDFPSGDPIPFLHVGARYYDPSSGRFLQRDPNGLEGGLNLYEYALSNPTYLIDPDGRGPFGWAWSKLPQGFRDWFGGGGHIPVLDPGKAQDYTLTTCAVLSIAAPSGALLKGTKILKNVKGLEWTLNKNYRIGWHRFANKKTGQMMNRPHYHRRPGIGNHRPWEGIW